MAAKNNIELNKNSKQAKATPFHLLDRIIPAEDPGKYEITPELLDNITKFAQRGMKLKNIGPFVNIDVGSWDALCILKDIKEAYQQGRYYAIGNAQAKRFERGMIKSEASLEAWYNDVAGDVSQINNKYTITDVGHEDVEKAVESVMRELRQGNIDAEYAIQMLKLITLKIALVEPEKAHTVMAIFDKSFEGL